MREELVAALSQYPILTLFLVIGLGYLVGETSILGFRFGVAGVLFVGLAVGALDPRVALPEVVPTLGLIIFVYAVGIHSASALRQALRRQGWRDNALAAGVLVFGALLAAGVAQWLSLPGTRAAGLYCGALTNTPALAAVREQVRERGLARGESAEQAQLRAEEAVVAYSLAYPVGVLGVLLCFHLLRRIWKPEFQPAEDAPEIQVRNFVVRNPGVVGRTLGDVMRVHKDVGFVVSRIRHEGRTDIAASGTRLAEGDIVVVVGDAEALERAEQIFGEPSDAHIEEDRRELDYRRVFVSSKEVVGKRIRDLDLPNRLHATITRVRRGDVDLVPAPDTRLELGDQVRVLTRKENFPAVREFFGDSIRGTAETDFGSVALGMVLGVLVGTMPIPLPGGQTVKLGLAGGPLLVALVLGHWERTGGICWLIPVSANLTLRRIGLLLFLAGVGTRAGHQFGQTVGTSGAALVLGGAVITFGVTLATMIIGYRVLKIPYDAVMGLVSGIQTQPACLAYATEQTRSETPNVAYAAVYPAATVLKIVLAQVLAAWPGTS
jgi:putative transport protein